MMNDMDPMKDALKRRKAKGIDITITIDPDGQGKETDLAPPGEAPEGDLAAEGMPEGQMLSPEQADMQELEELVSDMSEQDKMQAMEPGAKPMSLGQRARMEALGKLKQGK